MDGFSVNKFDQKCSKKFKEEYYQSPVYIGSLFLHVVHEAFRTGADRSYWGLRRPPKGICFYIVHQHVWKTIT